MILLVTRLFLVTQIRRKSLDCSRRGRARVTLIKRQSLEVIETDARIAIKLMIYDFFISSN
jgi:hypothetical protein